MTNPLPESAVELAARAIAEAHRPGHSWDWLSPNMREMYFDMARAALPAIREAVVGEFKGLLNEWVQQHTALDSLGETQYGPQHLVTRTLAALTEQENRNDQERSHDGG